MSEFKIIRRTEIGLPDKVTNTDGSPRPPLSLEPWYTIHYTGVDVHFGDVGDTPSEIRSLQNYAVLAKKPWEYNYVIGQDEDDCVYEYAGIYRAAHSAGENDDACGVLIMNGTRERMTDRQVRKVQWLRDFLILANVLRRDVETHPHKNMPGAATACPGPLVLDRWGEILEPYVNPNPPVPPPPPPPPTDVVHIKTGLHYVMPNESPWSMATRHYGKGSEWNKIVEANAPDTVPNIGERWKVPGFSGVDLVVGQGEGPWSIIRRAGQNPTSASVSTFYSWNGGQTRWDPASPLAIKPGDRVFVQYT